MSPEEAHILIIDDDPDVLASARLFLKHRFAQVSTAQSPAGLNELLAQTDPDVLLLDMNFRKGAHDGKEGMYWLRHMLEVKPTVPVVLMTAYAEVDLAVQAVKMGAADFIIKPWKNDRLLEAMLDALARKQPQSTDRTGSDNKAVPTLIGNATTLQRVLDAAQKVAPTDASVLILGENGTGKDVLAHYIRAYTSHRSGPFISVDMGAIPESLFESELFGHVRGAFTDARDDKPGYLERAQGGTLFLDEVANLPLSLQSKLLAVLQRRKVTRLGSTEEIDLDLRLICATNQPIHQLVSEKRFRQDLLYRINTVELVVPPLRERTQDISLLAQHYLDQYQLRYRKQGLTISRTALHKLEQHPWPGNIRELQHAVERAVILADGPVLEPDDFRLEAPTSSPASRPESSVDEALKLEEMERELIRKALERNQGNVSQTARDLGITRTALYRRLEKHGL